MNDINNSAGCFGKLPKFADFVKFNSGNNAILAFDQWLQNGIQKSKIKLKNEFEKKYNSTGVINFLFPVENSNNILAGAFLPSNDKSRRQYPFIISTSVPEELTNGSKFGILPLFYEKFYLQCGNVLDGIKEFDNFQNISDQIQNINMPSVGNLSSYEGQYRDYINITTTNKLWDRVFNNFDDEKKFLLIYNLTEILLPFRNNDVNTFKLGLKIPVSTEKEFTFANISFWADVCRTFAGSLNSKTFLFWNYDSENNDMYMTLFFNLPTADFFTHLIDTNYLPDNICLTEKDGNIENCKESLSDSYKKLLEQKEISLNTFLKHL